jgi:glucan phosphoethanolaminetransferase (alkaline phosphatase superfamily)
MNNKPAINIIRWAIAVPAGVMLWYAANHSVGIAFGIIHGFDRVDAFWEAPDMDGVPIIGTYIILVTRAVAAASLVGIIIYIVPRHHKQVAIITAALVTIGAVAIFVYQAVSTDQHISGEGWYKLALDMLSMMFGGMGGAWMAYQNQRRVRRPIEAPK